MPDWSGSLEGHSGTLAQPSVRVRDSLGSVAVTDDRHGQVFISPSLDGGFTTYRDNEELDKSELRQCSSRRPRS
jgi:hypothetical protein